MKENTAAIHAQVPVDVATYLLNEKRSEIFGIEARLKVNVLLIPNPNLATPNYNVERLRHDAPQLDEQKPSYEMVTVPDEEPVGLPTKSPQAVAPRPEPLVKGIRPDQPAPMSIEAPASVRPAPQTRAAPAPRVALEEKRGLLDTLFGWLKKPAATAPEAKPAAKPTLEERAPRDGQRQRDGQRRDRGDSRGDGRRDGRGGRTEAPREGRRGGAEQQPRGERRPDQQQPQQKARDGRGEPREARAERNEGREPREGREQREGRRDENRPPQNRPPRAPDAPRAEPAIDPQAPRLESHPVHDAAHDESGEGGGRRRRRRGGRGGDRADRPPRDNAQAAAPVSAPAEEFVAGEREPERSAQ